MTLDGVLLIVAERERQKAKWPAEHDDRHADGDLDQAAAALIDDIASTRWPWVNDLVQKHRGNRVRQLTIAGALIAAEIDRLGRAAARGGA